MSLGTRFRPALETSSLKTTFGAALVGVALLGSTFGGATAQEASPVACPPVASPAAVASPEAAPSWITDVAIDESLEATGDSTTVGVLIGEILEINVPAFETRPFVLLQTANNTEGHVTVVLLTAPEGFDPAAECFVLPADAAELPEGVSPYGSFDLEGGEQISAAFPDLPEGTYVLATSLGQSLTFTVLPATEVEVPDIFGTPEGTPAS